MAVEYKQMSLWKTVGAFAVFGPVFFGLAFWYLALGVSILYGEKFRTVDLVLPVFGALFQTFIFWASPFMGIEAVQFIFAPVILSAVLYWCVVKQALQRLSVTSEWGYRLVSGVFAPILYISAFSLFNAEHCAASWADLYFYRPGDKSIPDYSEWGSMDACGPLYDIVVAVLAGFVLGAVCSPEPIKPADCAKV